MLTIPSAKHVNYNHLLQTHYQLPSEMRPVTLVTHLQVESNDGRIKESMHVEQLVREYLAYACRHSQRHRHSHHSHSPLIVQRAFMSSLLWNLTTACTAQPRVPR